MVDETLKYYIDNLIIETPLNEKVILLITELQLKLEALASEKVQKKQGNWFGKLNIPDNIYYVANGSSEIFFTKEKAILDIIKRIKISD